MNLELLKAGLEGVEVDPLTLTVKEPPKDNGFSKDYIDEIPPAPSAYECLDFEDPITFALTFHPALKEGFHKFHNWQVGVNLLVCDKKWTSKSPLEFYLVAANGSGKDSFILAICVLFLICCTPRHRCVITTKDSKQMRNQTYPYIKALGEAINKWFIEHTGSTEEFLHIVEGHVSCRKTGGDIVMFVTDEPGRAEGYHPAPDHPQAQLSLFLNEAKNILKEIFQAARRCTGFSRYIAVSSAGFDSGYFYEKVQNALQWPAVPLPYKAYSRTITAYDCAHISPEEIENARHELESWLFESIYLSKFSSTGGTFAIPRHLLQDVPGEYGNTNEYEGGLDLSLGGDETSLVIRRGPRIIYRNQWKIADSIKLENVLATELLALNLPFSTKVNVDVGGLGKPIYHHLRKMVAVQWIPITNQSKPWNKLFRNVGAEDYFHVRTLFLRKLIPPPPQDPVLIDQLAGRRYEVTDTQAIKLESKEDARIRGDKSPDRADAFVLCYRRYRFAEINKIVNAKLEVQAAQPLDLSKPEDQQKLLDLIEQMGSRKRVNPVKCSYDILKHARRT